MKKISLVFVAFLFFAQLNAQVKILFDATKAEMAANADWVIDADLHNLGYNSSGIMVTGSDSYHTDSNPQQFPTPLQSTITSTSTEDTWEGAISAWGIDMVKKGFQVESLPYNGSITYGNSSNAQDLSHYKVFVVDEPNIKFTTAEKTAIMNFVQNGGGLFIVSDHADSDRNGDGWDSQQIWSDFMTNNPVQTDPFGISVDSANFSGTYSYIANLPTDSILHGVMGNVTKVQWSNGTSFTLNSAHNSSVKGLIYKTSSTTGSTNVLAARATYGSGKVFVLGDSSPTDDGTGDPNDQLYDGWITDASGNHEKLIINATIWLATSSTVSVSGISLNPTTLSLTVGGSTAQLTATIQPSNSTNQNVTWTSSNNNIATVSSTGVVSPVAVGNCTITVTTQDGGYTATCAVAVSAGTVSVTSVSVSPSTMTLTLGGANGQLTATIQPSNATNQTVIWTSGNNGIATVSSLGVVSPVAVGNCTITVTTQDGNHTATAQINVIQNTAGSSTIVNWSFSLPYLTGQYADGGIPANVGIATISREASYVDGYLYFAGAGATGDSCIRTLTWDSTGVEKYWLATFTTSNYQNLRLSSKQRSSTTAPNSFKVQYATNISGPWTDVTGTNVSVANDFVAGVIDSVALPAACNDQSTLYLRWLCTSSVAVNGLAVVSSGASRIDEVVVTGTLISNSINESNLNSNVSVFPNPVSNVLYINSTSNISYKIYDLLGNILINGDEKGGNGEYSINISGLQNGIYIIIAESGSKKIYRKFTVLK